MKKNPSMKQTSPCDKLEGVVQRIVFQRDTFFILRVRGNGFREAIVVGSCGSVSEGSRIIAEGTWCNNASYGRQFKAEVLRAYLPTTRQGIEAYLASGLIKGIGPHYAKKLIDAFGDDVFDVLKNAPHRLRSVQGLGRQRIKLLLDSWEHHQTLQDIMVFLYSHGLSTLQASRLYKAYGVRAVQHIQQNPYSLVRDIPGIGFIRADNLAQKLGFMPDSEFRLAAGLHHSLSKAGEQGHCGLPPELLLPQAAKLLSVDQELLHLILAKELSKGILINCSLDDTTTFIMHPELETNERLASGLVYRAMHTPVAWQTTLGSPDHIRQHINSAEQAGSFNLSPDQRHAVEEIVRHPFCILTGGPGVGKTTILSVVMRLVRLYKVRVMLTAPTGRAAKRLSESTGYEAKTIHRLLELDPYRQGGKGPVTPLVCDFLIVDEVSMVESRLFRALMQSVPQGAAVLLVGDPDQLPSVGPGRVLGDLLDVPEIARIHLSQVFRQGPESQSLMIAHAFKEGFLPPFKSHVTSDFFFLSADDPHQAANIIVDLVTRRLPQRKGFDPLNDLQVLCPMTRGPAGTKALNRSLQCVLNPLAKDLSSELTEEETFFAGDKVIQTVNNYDKEVYNGDVGFIRSLSPEGEAVIDFDGRLIAYTAADRQDLALAYALTIHKAQGSEYPVVIIPVVASHFMMLSRPVMYTGMTRGKKLVVLVGQRQALQMAARQATTPRRWTLLGSALKKLLGGSTTSPVGTD